jgi:hypothetical protein
MRIELQREGGIAFFPGLNRPIVMDTDTMIEEEANKLKELVTSARIFDCPLQIGTARPGAADYRMFTLLITDGSQQRTIKVIEPVEDVHLRALIQYLQQR